MRGTILIRSYRLSSSHNRNRSSCGGSPLIHVTTPNQLDQAMAKLNIKSTSTARQPENSLFDDFEEFDVRQAYMVYNEYGELVDAHNHLKARTTTDLSITEIMRLIRKAYHHDVSALYLCQMLWRGLKFALLGRDPV